MRYACKMPGDAPSLREVLHGLNNTAAIILANWAVVRGQLPSGDPVAADIDEAGRRLVAQLVMLGEAIEASQPASEV